MNAKDWGLFVLRVGVAIMMFIVHAVPKLNMLDNLPASFSDPIGLGSQVSFWLVLIAETVGSFLILIGLATRFAAIPLLFQMLVALFVAHAGDNFITQERAILYGIMYLIILIAGAGRLSFDAVIHRIIRRPKMLRAWLKA